ncbi:hypothetical protein HQ520_02935, partial [bacterium]|nr:hypothetical protein [bacterium]
MIMKSYGQIYLVIGMLIMLVGSAMAGSITIEEFILRPADEKSVSMKPGDAFDVGVRVIEEDAGMVTYIIRTVDPMEKADVPPVLDHYESARKFAFLSADDDIQLRENGSLDDAPATHTFRTRLSTEGWKPGRYNLAVFAHNSLEKVGGYTADQASFAVVIGDDQVRLVNMEVESPTQFEICELRPAVVKPGETAVLYMKATEPDVQGLSVRVPLHLAKEDALPGFDYDEELQSASLSDEGSPLVLNNREVDSNSGNDVIEVRLSTEEVKPGLYFMTVQLIAESGGKPATRHLALKVRSPEDNLKMRVSEPWIVWEGSSAG